MSLSLCARDAGFEWRHCHTSPNLSLQFFSQNFGIYLELCHDRLLPQLDGNTVCGRYSLSVTDGEQTHWSAGGSHGDVAVPVRTNYRSAVSFVVKQSANRTVQDETSAGKTSRTRRHFPGDLKLCQKNVGSFVGTNFHDHPVVCAVGLRLLEHPAGR